MSRWDNEVEKPPINVAVDDFTRTGDMCMAPDKSFVYMVGVDSGASSYAIGWVDPSNNQFYDHVVVVDNFAPFQLLISPDNAYAYTIKQTVGPNTIYKIDLSDGTTVATATPVGTLQYRFSMTPDGAFLTYGASRDAGGGVSVNMWKIDTSDMSIDGVISSASGGTHPIGECAFTSDSATAVACDRDAYVQIVDMATFLVTSTVAAPSGWGNPYQALMSADDSTCWVAMQNSSPSLHDAVIPLDMSGLTWGTPVVLNSSTVSQDVSEIGPLRFSLPVDESAVLFAHVSDYWRAVDIATSTVLKTVSLTHAVGPEVGWHGFAPLSDTKFYIVSTDSDYILWVEREGGPGVQVMRWW